MPPVVGGFRWNPTAARYVDARGRFVPLTAVRAALETVLASNKRQIASLATGLQSGTISLEQWRAGMRLAIKDAHLYSAAAARGGWAQMTRSDLGRVGQRVRYNYGRLERFARQIAAGKQRLDGSFTNRAGLYAGNARATYHRVEIQTQKEAGYDEERNRLRPADHCAECVELTRRGWVPIGTTTPIGERECLGNCQCGMEYRRSGESALGLTRRQLLKAYQQHAERLSKTPEQLLQEQRDALAAAQKKRERAAARTATTGITRNDQYPDLESVRQAQEDLIRTNPKESAYAWDASGNLLFAKKGTKRAVVFTQDETARVASAAVVTHNHPGGGTLSDDDLQFFAASNIQRFRAVGIEKHSGRKVTYEITRTGESASPLRFALFRSELKRVYSMAEIRRGMRARVPMFETTLDDKGINELYHEVMHERLERFVKADGRYTLTRRYE